MASQPESPAPAVPAAPLLMVCGRTITGNPTYFPQAEYAGKEVYFCTEYCLRAFLADPERFTLAHGKKSKTGDGPCDCGLK